jgi:hypothetical protein
VVIIRYTAAGCASKNKTTFPGLGHEWFTIEKSSGAIAAELSFHHVQTLGIESVGFIEKSSNLIG